MRKEGRKEGLKTVQEQNYHYGKITSIFFYSVDQTPKYNLPLVPLYFQQPLNSLKPHGFRLEWG